MSRRQNSKPVIRSTSPSPASSQPQSPLDDTPFLESFRVIDWTKIMAGGAAEPQFYADSAAVERWSGGFDDDGHSMCAPLADVLTAADTSPSGARTPTDPFYVEPKPARARVITGVTGTEFDDDCVACAVALTRGQMDGDASNNNASAAAGGGASPLRPIDHAEPYIAQTGSNDDISPAAHPRSRSLSPEVNSRAGNNSPYSSHPYVFSISNDSIDIADSDRVAATTTHKDQKQAKTKAAGNPQAPQPQPVVYKDSHQFTATASAAATAAAVDKADKAAATAQAEWPDAKQAATATAPPVAPKPLKHADLQQRLNKVRERLKHLHLGPARGSVVVIGGGRMAVAPVAAMIAAANPKPKRAGMMAGLIAGIEIDVGMRINTAGHREIAVKHKMADRHGDIHFGRMVADSVGNLEMHHGHARRIPQRNYAHAGAAASGSGGAGSGAGAADRASLQAARTQGLFKTLQRLKSLKTRAQAATKGNPDPLYDQTTTKQF